VNMSHRVHHLSFGQKFAEDELEILPDEVTDSFDKLKDREYVSTGQNQTHEHYIKVVGTTFKYLDVGTLSSYKYTSHSATYHANTKLPVIRFHYDISPMNVVITERVSPKFAYIRHLVNALCFVVQAALSVCDVHVCNNWRGLYSFWLDGWCGL